MHLKLQICEKASLLQRVRIWTPCFKELSILYSKYQPGKTWAVNLPILSSFLTILFNEGTPQALRCSNQDPKGESPLILLCDANKHCVGHQSYQASTSLARAHVLVHQIQRVCESYVISHDGLYL